MDLHLAGKTVLITGGSKGIGAACAHSFAAEGCNLILIARNQASLTSVQNEILDKYRVKVETHSLDLRERSDFTQAAKLCATVDILVNNAGDIPSGSLRTLDEAQWRNAWELKLFGYINLSREAYAFMVERQSGVIINVIGMAAERASYDYICGSTANAALAAFTKGLGLGSPKFGVRVMGVHPPSTRTERIEKLLKSTAQQRYGDQTRTADLIKEGVFLPAIEPQQVADAVTYLASPRASQLSGIVVNLG
jgi:NAD(P)-dependent dehydrogenase (short-subunit alcohol dehydrogenase family)